MPALLYALPAALSAGSTLMNWMTNKKNKPELAENTFMGRYLQDISERGIYSPEVRSRIMSNVGRDLGAVAQRSRGAISGRLAATPGLRNSIAAQRLLAEPEAVMSRSMADISSDLYTQNELSKTQAEGQFRALKDQSRAARRGYQTQTLNELGGGIMNTIAAGAQGYQQYSTDQSIESQMPAIQSLMMKGDEQSLEQANTLINILLLGSMRGGGG